jgi:hypothetical protein
MNLTNILIQLRKTSKKEWKNVIFVVVLYIINRYMYLKAAQIIFGKCVRLE